MLGGRSGFGQKVCSEEDHSTLSSSAHERCHEGGAHASPLPAVFNQHSDLGCVVADVQVPETDAAVAVPRSVRLVTGSTGQQLAGVAGAASDAVEATVEARR